MAKGIVVLGHGSRNEEANIEMQGLTAILAELDPDSAYVTAFLESGSPGLEAAVVGLYDTGVRNVVVMPVFVSTGKHVKRDIPNIIHRLSEAYPGLNVVMAGHLGHHPGLVKVIQDRIAEAESSLGGVPNTFE